MASKHNIFSCKKKHAQNTPGKKWRLIILYSIIVISAVTLALVSLNINKYQLTGEAIKPLQIKTATSVTINDKIIIYRGKSSSFFLKYNNTQAARWNTVVFGVKGDQYLMGDWDGDGIDEIGLYRNYTRTGTPTFLHRFILKTANTGDASFYNIDFPISNGVPAPGDLAIVGDWNNDGYDTVGFYRPTQAKFFLSNTKMIQGAVPTISETYTLGTPNRAPVIGDWNGDGKDTIGVFNSNGAGWALRWSSNTGNLATFSFGIGTDNPIVGDWDGDRRDNVGTYRPRTSTFSLSRTLINEGANNPPTYTTKDIITFGTAVNQDLGFAGKWIDCDADDDGYESIGCGGNDCDDTAINVNPGITYELCGDEQIDNNCDGEVDEGCDIIKCPNGLVRCSINQPQRCVIHANGESEYRSTGTQCFDNSSCEVYTIEESNEKPIANAVCSGEMVIVENRTILSTLGSITFPDRISPNDVRKSCIKILDGYYSVDTIACPNLGMVAGEKWKISLKYDKNIAPLIWYDSNEDSIMESCPPSVCKNVILDSNILTYDMFHNPSGGASGNNCCNDCNLGCCSKYYSNSGECDRLYGDTYTDCVNNLPLAGSWKCQGSYKRCKIEACKGQAKIGSTPGAKTGIICEDCPTDYKCNAETNACEYKPDPARCCSLTEKPYLCPRGGRDCNVNGVKSKVTCCPAGKEPNPDDCTDCCDPKATSGPNACEKPDCDMKTLCAGNQVCPTEKTCPTPNNPNNKEICPNCKKSDGTDGICKSGFGAWNCC